MSLNKGKNKRWGRGEMKPNSRRIFLEEEGSLPPGSSLWGYILLAKVFVSTIVTEISLTPTVTTSPNPLDRKKIKQRNLIDRKSNLIATPHTMPGRIREEMELDPPTSTAAGGVIQGPPLDTTTLMSSSSQY